MEVIIALVIFLLVARNFKKSVAESEHKGDVANIVRHWWFK